MAPKRFAVVLTVAALPGLAAGALARDEDPGPVLERVSRYVQEYYTSARSILAEETVLLQPLAPDLSPLGFARHLVYELRVEWDPDAGPDGPAATVVRQLVSAVGPPLGPPRQPDCLDPRGVSPEPLAFLLPDRREEFNFSLAGTGRVDGREAVRLDYRPLEAGPPEVEWENDCGRIELPGRRRGRIWVDPATSEILRLDEHLTGMVDLPGPDGPRPPMAPLWFTLERADVSIQYRPVTFEDPDETLMLPVRIGSLTIIRNSGVPRLRVTRTFANYRRFVTESRIVQ